MLAKQNCLKKGIVHIWIVLIVALANTVQPHSVSSVANVSAFDLYLPHITSSGPARLKQYLSWGSPIAISRDDAMVWVVNPDSNTVSVVNTANNTKRAELAVGREPCALTLSADGKRAYVLNRADGTLMLIDTQRLKVDQTLFVGSEPQAIVLSAKGSRAYITVSAADEVAVVDTQQMVVTARIAVAAQPYGIAINDEKIYVTHLQAFARTGGREARDDGREGRVTVLNATDLVVQKTIALAPNANGFPNMLSAISLQNGRAWVPVVQALPDVPNTLTQVVFAAVAALDTVRDTEDISASLPINDQDIFGSPVNNPIAAVPAPDGNRLYVVLAGSNLIEVVDVAQPRQPRLLKFLATGKNPRGIAISSNGKLGYVTNFLSRSITVLDLIQQEEVAEIPVTTEKLDAAVLRGKILFNTATDARIAGSSWVSCASCHMDGGTDGVTWMFPDGPRQTPPLWNSMQTLPWHWSAALDEPQDIENTVQDIQHGIGLAVGEDPPQLGKPNAGRSADLDALAVFMAFGIRVPNLPTPANSLNLAAGRQIFISAGCAVCHGGTAWTISKLTGNAGELDPDGNGMVDALLRNVGTVNPRDVVGATGFDVPSLLNVGLTEPYLHDGSLPTIQAVIESGHPKINITRTLTTDEIRQLVAFVGSIGATTPPVLSTGQ